MSSFLLALLALTALVVDIGTLQVARRGAQSTADFAATAGASGLNANLNGSARRGCNVAWAYLKLNAPTFTPAPANPCMAFPDSLECAAGTPARTVTATAGAWQVWFTTPVPDGNALLDGRLDAQIDGVACERFGVEIRRQVSYAFGPVVGVTTGTTTIHAVARSGASDGGAKLFSLLILEREGCDALTASGQAIVRVRGTLTRAGEIGVDSSATKTTNPLACTATKFAIDPSGTGQAMIIAEPSLDGTMPGRIHLYALAVGSTSGYDPNDVAIGILSPTPTRLDKPFTRNPVDWRYNCVQNGRDGIAGNADDCPQYLTVGAYINQLDAALGAGSGAPSGYSTFPRPGVPTDRCNQQPSDPDPRLPAGNWYVDCSTLNVKSQFTFQRGDVVFRGGVTVATGSRLSINAAGGLSDDATVVLRDGDLNKDATGSLDIRHGFVYVRNGVMTLNAGAGGLRWDAPNAGNFEDLAFWSESSAQHLMGGQANLTVEGVFFMPNANPFTFSGQGGESQTRAQFITRRLEVSGQGSLILAPDPDRAVLVTDDAVTLIR
jgi:hypothetical protein